MRNRIAFCAVLAALAANATEIQLLPAGEFRAIDGRPTDAPAWRIDAAIAERLRSQLAARTNPLPIDYEHQTMHASKNGQPAPAAGWLKSLVWREGQGLFGIVEWTERAKALIAAGEYRYISPVFKYAASSGEILDLAPPALVNYAGIDGMQAVALKAIAESYSDPDNHQETSMNPLLVAVLAALGLKEDTKPEAATATIAALQASAKETATLKAKVAELEPKAARVPELETSIAALKAGTPDPAKYVPIESVKELQTQVAALTGANAARDVEELVKGAMESGKILPAMENWARDLGKKDLAALKSYIASAAPIAALAGTQTNGKPPKGADKSKDPIAIAKLAREFMDAESKAGRVVSASQAVEHVTAAAA